MNIVDFFNPYNKKHIEAYKHLCKTSMWPENFLPENIEMSSSWPFELSSKIANCWIETFNSDFSCMFASEEVLKEEWLFPVEDEAWKNL